MQLAKLVKNVKVTHSLFFVVNNRKCFTAITVQVACISRQEDTRYDKVLLEYSYLLMFTRHSFCLVSAGSFTHLHIYVYITYI